MKRITIKCFSIEAFCTDSEYITDNCFCSKPLISLDEAVKKYPPQTYNMISTVLGSSDFRDYMLIKWIPILINYLKDRDILAVFHYVPLHSSEAGARYSRFYGQDKYTTKESQVEYIVKTIASFFEERI